MSVCGNWRKELVGDVNEEDVSKINYRYLKCNKYIFFILKSLFDDEYNLYLLNELDMFILCNFFMDYDCCVLLMVVFFILLLEEINSILVEV